MNIRAIEVVTKIRVLLLLAVILVEFGYLVDGHLTRIIALPSNEMVGVTIMLFGLLLAVDVIVFYALEIVMSAAMDWVSPSKRDFMNWRHATLNDEELNRTILNFLKENQLGYYDDSSWRGVRYNEPPKKK